MTFHRGNQLLCLVSAAVKARLGCLWRETLPSTKCLKAKLDPKEVFFAPLSGALVWKSTEGTEVTSYFFTQGVWGFCSNQWESSIRSATTKANTRWVVFGLSSVFLDT